MTSTEPQQTRAFVKDLLPPASEAGGEMMELVRAALPYRRSITGNGVRETLRLVDEWATLELTEVPSGSRVFDWIVPPEWNVRDAWIEDLHGNRIVDLAWHPLHVVGYSEPVALRLTGARLASRLHSLPARPEWIPYRTSYYDRTWGFCLTEQQRASIVDDEEYEVVIDSTLDDSGSLTFGEHVTPGSDSQVGEILISTYVCHPGMGNDNLSGIAVAAALARWIPAGVLRHDLRVVFAPATIGALCWLQHRGDAVGLIRHGLVVYCAGDQGPLTYKRSRLGSADIDRAAEHVLLRRADSSIHDFEPWGTDERQFCSPGFDLPVGGLSRSAHGLYPQYHTSGDDLDVVDAHALADSLSAVVEILDIVGSDEMLVRVDPRGEPQLGRHALDGRMTPDLLQDGEHGRQAILWVLNLADGDHSLLDVAERSGLAYPVVRAAADLLLEANLIRRVQ